MKVMLLSVSAGYGHHATAKALSDMLSAKGAEVETLDVYQYISRAVQKTIDKGYLFSSKHMPELYRLVYALAENHGTTYFDMSKLNMLNIVNALGSTRFHHILGEFAPDVIVCTHVFAAQLMNEMTRRGMVSAPVIGVVTDYTIHPFWEDVPLVRYIVTASELLTQLAAKRGINPNRILPFGIPIHPKFNSQIAKADACMQLGLDSAQPTLLMMGGSMGYSNSKRLIRQLSVLGMPLQILAVCGNNKKQYQQLLDLLEDWDSPCTLHPYGFVDNVEVMMSAADCIITKPGGLTVSEALAKNLPMILVDPIPGHEERNVEFLVNNGMAALVTRTFSLEEAIYHLYKNPVRLRTVRETMEAVSHPDATERLTEFVLQLQHPPLQTTPQKQVSAFLADSK